VHSQNCIKCVRATNHHDSMCHQCHPNSMNRSTNKFE
jgi:RNA polymerase subunit RPABC4/transcription elongation factor Spt4